MPNGKPKPIGNSRPPGKAGPRSAAGAGAGDSEERLRALQSERDKLRAQLAKSQPSDSPNVGNASSAFGVYRSAGTDHPKFSEASSMNAALELFDAIAGGAIIHPAMMPAESVRALRKDTSILCPTGATRLTFLFSITQPWRGVHVFDNHVSGVTMRYRQTIAFDDILAQEATLAEAYWTDLEVMSATVSTTAVALNGTVTAAIVGNDVEITNLTESLYTKSIVAGSEVPLSPASAGARVAIPPYVFGSVPGKMPLNTGIAQQESSPLRFVSSSINNPTEWNLAVLSDPTGGAWFDTANIPGAVPIMASNTVKVTVSYDFPNVPATVDWGLQMQIKYDYEKDGVLTSNVVARTWEHYVNTQTEGGSSGSMTAYISLSGKRLRRVAFVRNDGGSPTDTLLNSGNIEIEYCDQTGYSEGMWIAAVASALTDGQQLVVRSRADVAYIPVDSIAKDVKLKLNGEYFQRDHMIAAYASYIGRPLAGDAASFGSFVKKIGGFIKKNGGKRVVKFLGDSLNRGVDAGLRKLSGSMPF